MASASRTFVSSFARTAARKARSLRTAAIAKMRRFRERSRFVDGDAATDGELYIINAGATERQWANGEANLRGIVGSFYVPP